MGTVQPEVFESIADAVQFFGSEAVVLALANKQHSTNVQNLARRAANTKVSERTLEDKATKALTEDSEVLQRLLSLPKEERQAAARQEIAKKVEEFRAEFEAQRRTALAGVAAGPGEDEEDEDEEAATD